MKSDPAAASGWYEVGKFPDIQQGDIFFNVPIPLVPTGLYSELKPHTTATTLTRVNVFDVVVLTQSCDLARSEDPDRQIILCALDDASKLYPKKSDREDVAKGRRPALHLLDKCSAAELTFAQKIVSFQTIYTVPKAYLEELCLRSKIRVRLRSPYREHLSQAFARYFMRVGLPEPDLTVD
ncbi:MAG: hypothetical protein DYH07_09270 [Armatimonadetes bacterium ATM1]|nr:MAG: hypothetical protein EDM73_07615 [Armatimonadota bacterium]MBC6969958.1 hypothetical protein [Armatimonadota bacterium]MCE7900268.1 hypothetical protein [Armatimonadetes bacterium ATM1]RIJ96645.1 MAG: hypothetical protein DCC45_06355 [Armatimonadota bacterium]